MPKPKIIIWGFPLNTHTHSYIHASFLNAFKHLGYESYWFHDDNYPDSNSFDYSNSLFITEGFIDKKIPILKTSTYFVHNSVNPTKYLENDARMIDIRFNVSEINDYNYNMVINKDKLKKIDSVSFYDSKADDSVLGDKYKKGITGYEALYISWATNLLPHEINLDDRFLSRENKFYYVGSIGGSHEFEQRKIFNTLQKLNIPIININPWSNPCTFEQDREYMKKSIIALDVRGSDFYHTNSDGKIELHGKPVTGGNHKKIGYIPCRTIKQISYGRLPGTNSKAVKELFGDFVIYNDDESQLPIECLEFEKNPNHNLICEAMKYVKENHTYINRANSILKVYNQEV